MFKFFKIKSVFPAFKGQVENICQTSPDGEINIPHYVIEGDNGEIIRLAIGQAEPKNSNYRSYRIGQDASFKPGPNGSYSRLVIDFNFPQPVEGKVEAARTFLFGTELFFSHLLIANGQGYEHIAFRPFRRQKRQGLRLVNKSVIIDAGRLLVVQDGRTKEWPN